MKIPDLSGVTEKAESSEKAKAVDLGKIRKKKKRSRHLVKLIIVLILLIIAAFVWFNADTIFEPLRGIASRIDNKTSYDVGFPIDLPGSSSYSLMTSGDCFTMLTDTYLYAYDVSGEQLYALKHGYSKPHQATSSRRILIYDKSGYSFSIYNRASVICSKTTEDKIVYATIGSDGLAAVLTESSRYSDVLQVYDDSGNWKYTRKFADENVMQVAFPGDGEHIIVTTISSKNGGLLANIYRLSIKETDGYIWKYTIIGGSLPCALYADRNRVTVLCDNCVTSLGYDNGELLDNFAYTGILKHFSLTPERTLVLYNDISANRNVLVALEKDSAPYAQVNVSAGASCVYSDAEGIYILDGARIRVFDTDLIAEKQVNTSDDDYSDFIKLGNSIVAIGYRHLNEFDVNKAE